MKIEKKVESERIDFYISMNYVSFLPFVSFNIIKRLTELTMKITH